MKKEANSFASDTKALFEKPDISLKKSIREILLMIMLYDTGARIEEILNLKICDGLRYNRY